MFVITITAKIMFQDLILTLRLIVDLKMKRRAQFTLHFNSMTNDESIFTVEQEFSIRDDIFNAEKRQ